MNGSTGHGKVGIGVTCEDSTGTAAIAHSPLIDISDSIDVSLADPQAIQQAGELVISTWSVAAMVSYAEAAKVKHVIYSDSKTALHLLLCPR